MFGKQHTYVAGCLRCQNCSHHLRGQFFLPKLSLRQRKYLTTTCSKSAKPSANGVKAKSPTRINKLPTRIERLKVDVLGEPSHVVILDKKANKPEQRLARVAEKEAEDENWKTPTQLLKELNKERSELGPKKVTANLDHLKSLHEPGEALSAEAWAKLRRTVQNGFTVPQLTEYVNRFKNSEATSPNGAGRQQDKQLGWKAGTSLFLDMEPIEQERITKRVPGLKGMRGKVLLAEKVIRECWQLVVRDEIGQLDVHLDSRTLSVLLLSRDSPLKSFAEISNATIDISQSSNLVRITGSEESCADVQTRLNALGSEMRSIDVSLSDWDQISNDSQDHLASTLVPFLQHEYGVLCEADVGSKKFTIYHLPGTELDAQQLRRTLYIARDLARESHQKIVTNFPDSSPANLYPVLSPDSMTWSDRQKQWFRWAKPFIEATITEGRAARRPPSAIYSRDPAAPLSKISNLLFQEPKNNNGVQLDPRFTRETVTAVVGKCLFQDQLTHDHDTATFPDIEALSVPRTFVTDIPNTLSFWDGLRSAESNDTDDKSTFRIQLLPSQKNEIKLPTIELELQATLTDQASESNSIPILRRATAIIEGSTVDMLLPETSLDIRFNKTLHYDLLEGQSPSDSKDNASLSSLLKCAENFQYRLPLSDAQPPMPLFCNLAIPQTVIETINAISPRIKEPTNIPSDQAVQTEEYVTSEYYTYPPLQSLTDAAIGRYVYKDLELNFTSQNTGPFLPMQTTEASLSLGRYDDEVRPPTATPKRQLRTLPLSDETEGSLRVAFRPLYIRACQLAFELGALQTRNPEFDDPFNDHQL